MNEIINAFLGQSIRFFEQEKGLRIRFIGQHSKSRFFHIIHNVIHNCPQIYDEIMNFLAFLAVDNLLSACILRWIEVMGRQLFDRKKKHNSNRFFEKYQRDYKTKAEISVRYFEDEKAVPVRSRRTVHWLESKKYFPRQRMTGTKSASGIPDTLLKKQL